MHIMLEPFSGICHLKHKVQNFMYAKTGRMQMKFIFQHLYGIESDIFVYN